MSKSSHELLNELRERLLRAGVAPRHVRRYIKELADHLADLRAEKEREGRSPADAESESLMRLGSMDDLAKAMTERKEFQSWCVRAPWAMFGLAPILFLTGAYLIALLILWSGWQIFLPGSDTPFVQNGWVLNLLFWSRQVALFRRPGSRWLGNWTNCRPPKTQGDLALCGISSDLVDGHRGPGSGESHSRIWRPWAYPHGLRAGAVRSG